MSLTPPYLYGCSKLQLVVDQRTETFFIFADLCLTKKAANILLVRSGAFWIWRPLGLSKELKDDKCLGLSKELNDDKCLVLGWSWKCKLDVSMYKYNRRETFIMWEIDWFNMGVHKDSISSMITICNYWVIKYNISSAETKFSLWGK